MSEIINPHDRFFKEVFSRPDVAEDFLLHYLPPHVSGLLEPNSLRLHKDSFVDSNLREYFSDLLYQVQFSEGQQGFVYILFEHKSYPVPNVAFQLLRYMMPIWEYSSKQLVGSLAPIFPLVLYHGSTRWRIPLNFASLYLAPESLKEGLCDFTYCLCDLSAYTDSEIKMGAMATVALLLLKNIRSVNLGERLGEFFALLRTMSEQSALDFLETTLRYVGAAAKTVTIEDCRKALESAFPNTGDMYMDRWTEQLVAERKLEWLKEGIREGIQEGLRAGKQEGLEEGLRAGKQEGIREGAASLTIRLLLRKFGGLDAGLEERVRQLSFADLERLGEELFDLPDESSLAEWLERLGKSHS